ncbi:unnamed protein product, partial [Medioppia subpectinata]
KIIHSRDIVSHWDLKEYEDKTAVVVGIGNSGCDSAVELRFLISAIRHTYRYEAVVGFCTELAKTDGQLTINFTPDFCTNCGVFSRFDSFVGDTDITECDLVVMATGYDHSFPFVDKSLFDHSSDEALNLYKQIFPQQLSHSSLGFIGALQPNGGIFALFEMQSRLYALLMTGKCRFPSHDHIVADIALTKQRRDQLFMKLVFGPTLPYQYRLRGPHSWCGARDALMQSDYRLYREN